MTYRVEACERGGQWHQVGDDVHSEVVACAAFDRELARGTRGVRVLDGEGHQLACVWPKRRAA